MIEPDRTVSYRCSICALNWPHHERFAKTCPSCDQPMDAPIRFTDGELAMTLDEADAWLSRLGLPAIKRIKPQPPIVGQQGHVKSSRLSPGGPTPVPVRRTPTKDEIRKLYDDFERWAHEVPPWLKR